jgi:hypothetical protein
MAQYMTAVAQLLHVDSGAEDRLIVSPTDLVERLVQVVQRLEESNRISRVIELGPLSIKLTFHGVADGAEIFDVFPSVRTFADTQTKLPQRTDFVIHVIDGASCGVKRPRLNWRAADFSLKRLVPGWSDNERTTYFLRSEGGLAVVDWESNRAYVWVPSIEALTVYERAAPFRWIIDGLAQRRGLMTMHAAVIGEGGIGLLIVGEGGRGKSTLALAAVGAGMNYLADDYCLVDAKPPYPAYRLFNTAKLRVDSRVQPNWIAGLEHETEPMSGDKRIFNLARIAPGALADRLEIHALLLPEFTDAALSALEMASPNEAFRRAAPSTVAQCEGSEARAAAAIGHLARTLPSFWIRMPQDPHRSIERIRELIQALRPSPAEASW